MDKNLTQLKQQQTEIFSTIAKKVAAIASPVRVQLIHFLAQGPLTVEVLANKIDQSIANTSMHLRKMASENIVNCSVQGQKRLYSIGPELKTFWEACQDFAESPLVKLKLETNETYGEINSTYSNKELKKMYLQNEIIILDVRPLDEVSDARFEKIKCYQHIPAFELKHKLKNLSKEKMIFVFCRGRFCALSAYAVNLLRQHKFKSFRLELSSERLIELLS
jgi:DNA-binding transcriptional ArsR family regulator